MRVAVVENTRITHHGQVGVALHEAGALVDQFQPFAGQPLPRALGEYDALVVLGGDQSALDDAKHPYLPQLAALMRAFSDMDRPVLGVCLGAQILARAFGAENHIGTAREFGWQSVTLTDDGMDDPLLLAVSESFPIFQWHEDTFTLPEGATLLATSAGAANQAFRIGRATYGTQFHFEASRAVVADWTRTFPDLTEGMQKGWSASLPDRAKTLGVSADETGLAIARAWVGLIE
jgi:GMP synthase (glutamine-hydrolysing)